jgi:hypothetical protein
VAPLKEDRKVTRKRRCAGDGAAAAGGGGSAPATNGSPAERRARGRFPPPPPANDGALKETEDEGGARGQLEAVRDRFDGVMGARQAQGRSRSAPRLRPSGGSRAAAATS